MSQVCPGILACLLISSWSLWRLIVASHVFVCFCFTVVLRCCFAPRTLLLGVEMFLLVVVVALLALKLPVQHVFLHRLLDGLFFRGFGIIYLVGLVVATAILASEEV